MKSWFNRFKREFWNYVSIVGWEGFIWVALSYILMMWVVGIHNTPILAHELRIDVSIIYPLVSLFILSLMAAHTASKKDD